MNSLDLPFESDGGTMDRRVKVAVRIRPLLDKPSERYDATCAFKSSVDTKDDKKAMSPKSSARSTISPTSGGRVGGPDALSGTVSSLDGASAGASVPTGLTLANPETKDSHVFAYDVVFDASDGQEAVFDQSISQPLSEALEDGSHFTVVTYGQTGSGKTFTLLGEPPRAESSNAAGASRRSQGGNIRPSLKSVAFEDAEENQHQHHNQGGIEHPLYLHQDSGVYLRLMHDILAFKQSKRNTVHVVVALSVVEIYNDTIRDLLKEKGPVQFREIGEDLLLINQTQVTIRSQRHVLDYFEIAYTNRAVSATHMNTESSRSHALFFVDVFQQVKTEHNPEPPETAVLAEHAIQSLAAAQNLGKVQQPGLSDRILGMSGRKSEGIAPPNTARTSIGSPGVSGGGGAAGAPHSPTTPGGNPSNDFSLYPVTHSRIILVDLAGSERVKKSGVTGAQLHETLFVNKSLSALGLVVNHLCLGSKHVPFRDSKMTRILRNSFVLPNSKILFIANISPASGSFNETLTSLRFASRLKELKPPVSSNQPYMQASVLEDQTLRKKHLMEELSADIRIAQGTIENYKRVLRFHLRPFGIAPLSSPYQPTNAKTITAGVLPSTQAVRSLLVSYKQCEEQRVLAEEAKKNADFQKQVKALITSQFDAQSKRYDRLTQRGLELRKTAEGQDAKLAEVKESLRLVKEDQAKMLAEHPETSSSSPAGVQKIKALEAEVAAKRKQCDQVQLNLRGQRVDLRKGALRVEAITTEWKQESKDVADIEEHWAKVTAEVNRLQDYLRAKNASLEARLENSSLERLGAKHQRHLEDEVIRKSELEKKTSSPTAPTAGGGSIGGGSRNPAGLLPEEAKFKSAMDCNTISPLGVYFAPQPLKAAVFKSWGPSPPPSPVEADIPLPQRVPAGSASPPPLASLSPPPPLSRRGSGGSQSGATTLTPFHRQTGSGSGSRLAALREETTTVTSGGGGSQGGGGSGGKGLKQGQAGARSGSGHGDSGGPSTTDDSSSKNSATKKTAATGGGARQQQVEEVSAEEKKLETKLEAQTHNQAQEDAAVRHNITVLKALLQTLDAITASPGGQLQQSQLISCLNHLNDVRVTQGGVVEVVTELHQRGVNITTFSSESAGGGGRSSGAKDNNKKTPTKSEWDTLLKGETTPRLLFYLSQLSQCSDEKAQVHLLGLSPFLRVLQGASLFTSAAVLGINKGSSHSSGSHVAPPYDTSVLVDWFLPSCRDCLCPHLDQDTIQGGQQETKVAGGGEQKNCIGVVQMVGGEDGKTLTPLDSGIQVVLSAEYMTKQHQQHTQRGLVHASSKATIIPSTSLIAFVDSLMTGCGL